MDYRKVTAIFPDIALEQVEINLIALGISGMTVSKAHGMGEYRDYYAKDYMSDCVRVEIFTEAEKAKEIVNTIARTVHQGTVGAGMIAVLPVEKFMHIREFSEDQSDDGR